jgi:hypothetical protein
LACFGGLNAIVKDVDDYVSNVNDKIDDTLNPDVVALTKNSTPKEL